LTVDVPMFASACTGKGAIVTIDAMGCQRSIAQRIVAEGADYVLAVKENQSVLLARVRKAIDAMEAAPELFVDFRREHCEIDKDHGRIETRRCVVTDRAIASNAFEDQPLTYTSVTWFGAAVVDESFARKTRCRTCSILKRPLAI
jgi:predicted transposase YbfD/YdcC